MTLSLLSLKTMETCEDGNDLVFFYQLCQGVASATYASHTAAQAGLPDPLIARGKEVSIVCNTPISGSLEYTAPLHNFFKDLLMNVSVFPEFI